MNADKEYTLIVWNRIVADHGTDAVQLADSRAEFAAEYQRDVMAGKVTRPEMSLIAEGEALFDKHVIRERDRRRKGRHGFAENIANSLFGTDDPLLDIAVPVGDGTDKVLRFWTIDDWRESIRVRERAATDAAESAAEHAKHANSVIVALANEGGGYTGDLFSAKVAA